MKKITLPSGEYLMVEVPKFEPHLCPYIGNIRPALMYWEENDLKEIALPPLNYTLIGLCSEISEEEAAKIVEGEDRTEIVDYNAGGGGRINWVAFKDYMALENGYEFDLDATESLASLVRSNGMEVDTTVLLKIKN